MRPVKSFISGLLIFLFAGSSSSLQNQWSVAFSYWISQFFFIFDLILDCRELKVPWGPSPEPTVASATAVIQSMRGLPLLYGGLVLDADGLEIPRVLGGCNTDPCNTGEIYLFDTLAQGWENVVAHGTPYPSGRAGHTMTGGIILILTKPQSLAYSHDFRYAIEKPKIFFGVSLLFAGCRGRHGYLGLGVWRFQSAAKHSGGTTAGAKGEASWDHGLHSN